MPNSSRHFPGLFLKLLFPLVAKITWPFLLLKSTNTFVIIGIQVAGGLFSAAHTFILSLYIYNDKKTCFIIGISAALVRTSGRFFLWLVQLPGLGLETAPMVGMTVAWLGLTEQPTPLTLSHLFEWDKFGGQLHIRVCHHGGGWLLPGRVGIGGMPQPNVRVALRV